MKKYWQAIECVLFLADPALPDRKPAWHVTAAYMMDPEDGETAPVILRRETMSMEKAAELKLTLPKIADDFNAKAVIAHAESEKASSAAAAAQGDMESKLNACLSVLGGIASRRMEDQAAIEKLVETLKPSA